MRPFVPAADHLGARVGTGLGAGLLLLASATAGCRPQSAEPFEIIVHVESDPGIAMPGAMIVRDGREVTTTAVDGRARLALLGSEGDSADLFVRCPAGFQSPLKPITASLFRFPDDSKQSEYAVACPPSERRIVVAVRAENGPNLPVIFQGKELARTDAAGAAHLLLLLKTGEQFEISLKTSERGNERLRPQNPAVSFVVKAHDDIVTFDQRFGVDRTPVRQEPAPR